MKKHYNNIYKTLKVNFKLNIYISGNILKMKNVESAFTYNETKKVPIVVSADSNNLCVIDTINSVKDALKITSELNTCENKNFEKKICNIEDRIDKLLDACDQIKKTVDAVSFKLSQYDIDEGDSMSQDDTVENDMNISFCNTDVEPSHDSVVNTPDEKNSQSMLPTINYTTGIPDTYDIHVV